MSISLIIMNVQLPYLFYFCCGVLFAVSMINPVEATVQGSKELEEKLFQKYHRKHRPVQKDSDQMNIQIYLLIGHVEFVDEHEQTMLLHGLLWATWNDTNLTWKPSDYNNTKQITVGTYKIWLPALSLYNSARGHGWNLHMGGLPAAVKYDGTVWASGSFSFHVTCLFDFTDYPYDVQTCPIVIADWVYDLSKVNLSDPEGIPSFKPAVKLSYDPLNELGEKTTVNGWKVVDTYRKHCYWKGGKGCMQTVDPDENISNFWSVLEFGVMLARHAPYFGLTVILPCLFVSILTLTSFWIDTISLATAITVFSILLQGLFGWDLIKSLPPGSGGIPKIVSLYGFNLSMTAISFVIHVMVSYLEYILPENIEFPFQLTNITERLRGLIPFQVQGLSFDPQKLLVGEETMSTSLYETEQNPPQLITPSEDVFLAETSKSTDDVPMAEKKSEAVIVMQDQTTSTPMQESSTEKVKTEVNAMSHIAQQLFVLRRIMFFIFLICYIIALPVCLL